MTNLIIKSKQYMVSRMEDGQRIKFFVDAPCKSDAITQAKANGLTEDGSRISVQQLRSALLISK